MGGIYVQVSLYVLMHMFIFFFQYKIYNQVHWNNPEERSDYVDSSGMTFYYTSRLRQNDGLMLMAGSFSLEIPPGLQSVDQEGTCRSDCTSALLPEPIYFTNVFLHMHYLG